jgi:hypothetical protein
MYDKKDIIVLGFNAIPTGGAVVCLKELLGTELLTTLWIMT